MADRIERDGAEPMGDDENPGSVISYAALDTKAISKKIYKRRETILARIRQSDSVVHSAH